MTRDIVSETFKQAKFRMNLEGKKTYAYLLERLSDKEYPFFMIAVFQDGDRFIIHKQPVNATAKSIMQLIHMDAIEELSKSEQRRICEKLFVDDDDENSDED